MKKSIAVVSASLGLLSVVSPCSQAAFTVSSSSVKTPVKNGINMSSPENAKMLKSGAVAAGCFGFIGAASFILFQSNKEEKSNSVLTPKKSGGEIVSRNGEAKENAPASEVETKKDPKPITEIKEELEKIFEGLKPEKKIWNPLTWFNTVNNSFSYNFVKDFIDAMNKVADLKGEADIFEFANGFLMGKFEKFGFDRTNYVVKAMGSYHGASENYKKEFSYSEHIQCAIYNCGCELLRLIIAEKKKEATEKQRKKGVFLAEENRALTSFTNNLGTLLINNGYDNALKFISKEIAKFNL